MEYLPSESSPIVMETPGSIDSFSESSYQPKPLVELFMTSPDVNTPFPSFTSLIRRMPSSSLFVYSEPF